MKIVDFAVPGAIGGAIVSAYYGDPIIHTAGFALVSGAVTAAIWGLAHILARATVPISDAQFMQRGRCPACHRQGSLKEVTSDDERTIVQCLHCTQGYAIRSSERGPIVKRIGQ